MIHILLSKGPFNRSLLQHLHRSRSYFDSVCCRFAHASTSSHRLKLIFLSRLHFPGEEGKRKSKHQTSKQPNIETILLIQIRSSRSANGKATNDITTQCGLAFVYSRFFLLENSDVLCCIQ